MVRRHPHEAMLDGRGMGQTWRVDLRSDTVTRPSAAMRVAIGGAEVGDDVLGDDPTVQALQARAAAMLGKEAALFVPSGTMANAVAIRTHTSPGDELVAEATSHIYVYEGGGYAAMSGCSIALVQGSRGLADAAAYAAAIRKAAGSLGHFPDATLVCVEQTHNRGGGTIHAVETIDAIAAAAADQGCAVHIDGARLFNAVVASGIDAARMVEAADTVSICLSKGLGAPVGSLLVGSSEAITRAHRWRKMFGGGMRQAGVLAAAGLFALEHHVERLEDDHARARTLAEAADGLPGLSVDLDGVVTNMVYIDLDPALGPAAAAAASLQADGIGILDVGPHQVRAVTHLDVDDEGIAVAIDGLRRLASN